MNQFDQLLKLGNLYHGVAGKGRSGHHRRVCMHIVSPGHGMDCIKLIAPHYYVTGNEPALLGRLTTLENLLVATT